MKDKMDDELKDKIAKAEKRLKGAIIFCRPEFSEVKVFVIARYADLRINTFCPLCGKFLALDPNDWLALVDGFFYHAKCYQKMKARKLSQDDEDDG